MLSLPIQISVLTQEKKSLPTKSDKSDATGESAETAKAGNYSLSLERVLFKFGFLWVLRFFVFFFLILKTKSSHSQLLLTAVTYTTGRN